MQTDTTSNEVITKMKLSSNLFTVAFVLFLVGAHSECQHQDNCSPEWSDLCEGLGATCEPNVNADGKRHDLCRWDDVNNSADCASGTLGIWTWAWSSYAQNSPCAVKEGRIGACITDVSNVDCSFSLNHACRRNGGICERMRSVNGDTSYVCRWLDYNQNECEDETEVGVWTTPESGYGQHWESVFYNGDNGACLRHARSDL